MKITTDPVDVQASQKNVFEFLSDFNNFEQLMPEQITNWKSDSEQGSFTIQGMADITLKISNKVPNSRIEILPVGKTPIQFSLILLLEPNELNEQHTTSIIEIDANLNPMMAMMAKKPLENLVKVIGKQLNKAFTD